MDCLGGDLDTLLNQEKITSHLVRARTICVE